MTYAPLTREHVVDLYGRGLLDLVYEAAGVHRRHHDPSAIQCGWLFSVKTGGCPEDCAYCPQSVRYDTGVEADVLVSVDAVVAAATRAKQGGADRFCMGAAWRKARDGPEFDRVLGMVAAVKALGLETCVTLGMVDREQAERLRRAGLDYYNHNLDTGRDFYASIITTRTYDDRLETLRHVRDAGLKVCCGGILGMGESHDDRIDLLHELARHTPQPESVPIQHAGGGRGDAARRSGVGRVGRARSRDCGRSHPHARCEGAAQRRTRADERGDADALFSRRRELDLPPAIDY